MQRQYSGELQQHVHALQDECRAHVGQEESKLRKELTSALTHESQVCKDSEVLSYQEVAQLRGFVAAQQEELRSIHSDCAELQRRSAATEAELQRKSTHEEHALYQHFDDAIKERDAQVHTLQHELSRLQEKQRVQLEAECFEAERRAASIPVAFIPRRQARLNRSGRHGVSQVALALSTWNSLAVPYWSDIYGRAERDYERWRKSTIMSARYKHETRFLYGRKAPVPPNCDAIEALLRLELLTQFPNWLSQKATMLGCTSSHDILKMALKEIFPNEDATRL